MSTMPIVTVIYQINCSPSFPTAKASLWVAKGDATDPNAPYPEEDPNALRFCGPIEMDVAQDLEVRLKDVLQFLGFDVRSATVPDD